MTRLGSGIWLAAWVGLCTVVGGCESQANKDIPDLIAFLHKGRPPVAGLPYQVLPPDVISINSQHVPEIDKVTQTIRPDGKLNLPLMGEVYVAGMTPREIELTLIKEAKKYYRDEDEPGQGGRLDVNVQVIGYNSQKIFVFGPNGTVGNPGPQVYTGCDTVLDILAKCQPTFLAWPEHIKIIRARKPNRGGYVPYNSKFASVPISSTQPEATTQADAAATQPDGMDQLASSTQPDFFTGDPTTDEPMAKDLEIDLMVMMEHGDLSRNVLLYPGDQIFVPANPLAAVGLALQLILFPVQPVLTAAQIPATLNSTSLNITNPTGK